ncbi:hypothetical protein FGSG_13597 [Fusarium graminearum PH-1]|uniref:hypothetical protein n=1 Tax=Gibberella zeae (strain ATCC MYA-4620 / CBS 123657 / FGSC 9075 / NRRL 31084 / PH-1) TaxID=229533 RepID=UPI00021F13FE|nr:hypothetical protein FGSG_13597 [Fusarium graminearum PH-1]ESU16086.1 hypothetical protein FGSG_13597 [Fusarium graminearum PH-1]|eukprot:XP_011328230.1 hypothetical protein FGSG_13597 [Fusarium graminearum PH-1]
MSLQLRKDYLSRRAGYVTGYQAFAGVDSKNHNARHSKGVWLSTSIIIWVLVRVSLLKILNYYVVRHTDIGSISYPGPSYACRFVFNDIMLTNWARLIQRSDVDNNTAAISLLIAGRITLKVSD